MLKFDIDNKAFERLAESDLTKEQILERYDFQLAIINSWETIKYSLGLPEAFLIGEEITPHASVNNSIDLLAFNPEDSSLIVIELKRNKNKLQLLQALSYAAMVETWDNEKLINEIQRKINPDPEELIDYINNNELNTDISIILVAESYDPEVIITAEWLSRNYGVNITAFAVSIHRFETQYLVNFEQRLPLKELSDVYEERGFRSKGTRRGTDVTWEHVYPKLQYSFGKPTIELCLLEKDGEPSRRRFGSFRSNYDGFSWISLNFREKYINVYLKGNPDDAVPFLKSKFTDEMEVQQWKDGHSFKVHTEQQCKELINWLKIGEGRNI